MGRTRRYRDLNGEERELAGKIEERFCVESYRPDPDGGHVLVQLFLGRCSDGLWLAWEDQPLHGPPPLHDPVEAGRRAAIEAASGLDQDRDARVWSDPVVQQLDPDQVRQWFDQSKVPLPASLIADLGLPASHPIEPEPSFDPPEHDGFLLPREALFGPTGPTAEQLATLRRSTRRALCIAESYDGRQPACRSQLMDAIVEFEEASFEVEKNLPDEWAADPSHSDFDQGLDWARRIIFGIGVRTGFRARTATTHSWRPCSRLYWPPLAEPLDVEIRPEELAELKIALSWIEGLDVETGASIPASTSLDEDSEGSASRTDDPQVQRYRTTAPQPQRPPRRDQGKAPEIKGYYAMVWKRDNRRPTPKEVAENVGCSRGHASRVMREVDSILAEMERREAENRLRGDE